MSQFKELVKKVFLENNMDWEAFDNMANQQLDFEKEMQNYEQQLLDYGQVEINDVNMQNKFFDYIYNTETGENFDPNDLRKEGNVIYLV